MPFLSYIQTTKTIRRIKTDLTLDTGKALIQRDSTAGRRSSWHGVTDTTLNKMEANSGSMDKLRQCIVSKKGGEMKHMAQERTSQIIVSTGGDANKATISNILLTKNGFLETTIASDYDSSEGVLTSVKIT